MNAMTEIKPPSLPEPVTRGHVQAVLGEVLTALRVMCRDAERDGQDVSHNWQLIEEAQQYRWAS